MQSLIAMYAPRRICCRGRLRFLLDISYFQGAIFPFLLDIFSFPIR